MLQLSTVCSKFKQAIVLVPSVRVGINTHPWPEINTPDRLNSPLLLCWVAQARHIVLHQDTHNVPGMAEFLAAAVQARSLCTICENPVAAAEAGHLMSYCHGVRKIEIVGTRPPSLLPDSLEEIVLDCEAQGLGDEFDDRQVNAFLYHCTRLAHLRQLRLDLSRVGPVQLLCAAQLRMLDRLNIELTVSECHVCLDWALAQPCKCLDIEVDVATSTMDRHTPIVEQLSQVRMRWLRLSLEVYFTAAMQALWAAVQAEHLAISFWADFGPIEMLPRCTSVVLEQNPADSGQQAAFIKWAAISKHACDIAIHLESLTKLHVTGFGLDGETLEQLQQPWQLVVCGGAGVQGLPASQPTRNAYFLQNAAAQAAGWTEVLNQR